MEPLHFALWLQGRVELLPDQPPTLEEWKMIQQHLALVFKKVTPPLGQTVWQTDKPAFHQLSDQAIEIMETGGINWSRTSITC